MSFYGELSKVYEYVFPLNKNTLKFISENLKEGDRILDLACGSGDYSIALSKMGFKVDGIDLEKNMIEKAIGKNINEENKVNFISGDMTKINEIFKENKYNSIFCVGNSIVHLEDKDKIFRLIKDIYSMLENHGELIIQIVNYDRIVKFGITELPTIRNSEVPLEFIRHYIHKPENNKVDFNTKLVLKGGKEIYENSVPLLIIKSEELVSILLNVGFTDIKLFGSFLKEEFTIDSFSLVVRAKK
ncbi:class I SAM-dependent methyltransferase [Clostridium sp. Marseille-QA1073]